ncbi:MAG: ABC transporter substrate-binding protein [Chloroflexi bacterium]|nr:ABC transporter substrate-binding protein [Chloroflexota bacterium]
MFRLTIPVRPTRRETLRLFLAGVGMGLVAACTSSAPALTGTPPPTGLVQAGGQPTTTVQVSSTAPASQPKTGGTLRFGLSGDLTSLDPHVIVPGSFDTLWQVYDRLTAYDATLRPQPMLAESWDISSDARQIKLNLRKGVQFHSGRELTSDDVNFTLNRIKDPKTGVGQFVAMSSWFTSLETPDKYTVLLRSDQPRPDVFDLFEYLNIVDSQTVTGAAPPDKLIGSGPFTWGEYVQGDHFILSKNQNYWQTGKPYLDEIRVQIVRDPQAAVTQLEAGALDLFSPPAQDAARLAKDANYTLIVNPISGSYQLFAANCQLPPCDNKLVRQALNYAIDRQRISDTVFLGLYGSPRDLPWPDTSPAAEPSKNMQYAFDLDKAKSLLQQAGVSTLSLDFILAGGGDVSTMAQIYQADLAKIGVTLNIKSLEPPGWRTVTASLKDWNINGASSDYSQLLPSSLATLSAWWSYASSSTGFKDEQYTQLVTGIAGESDAAKRKQLMSQLNDYLLDQSFVMVIVPNPAKVVVRAALKDVGYTGHESLDLTSAWLA